LAFEATRYDTLTEQLEALHLDIDKAAPVISPPLKDFL